jgi:sulfatase modifying factor 1
MGANTRARAGLAAAAALSVGAATTAPTWAWNNQHRVPRRHAPLATVAPPATSAASPRAAFATLRTPESAEVWLASGTFELGSRPAEVQHAQMLCALEPRGCYDPVKELADELPAHQVTLSAFFLDRFEVTVGAYRRCVWAGACAEPPYAAGASRFDQPELPVVLVTHSDASRYCSWLGKRLPTEAEWERAARGKGPSGAAGRRYPWGEVYNPFLSNHGRHATLALDAIDGFLELAPVGSFRDGRTPEGVADLSGNVEEWVADWYEPGYPAEPSMNPAGPPSGVARVVRGGSYTDGRPHLRAAARRGDAPGRRHADRGFRCARSADG